jgi:hypothetical protein
MKGKTGIKMRRQRVANTLAAQLVRGTKPEKINGKTTSKMIELSESDKKRIAHELEVLNNPKNK